MRGGDPPSRIGDDSVGAGVGTARGHPVGHLLTGDDTFVLQKRRCIERVSPELSVFYSVMGNAPCDGVGVGSGFGFRIPQRGYVYSNLVIPSGASPGGSGASEKPEAEQHDHAQGGCRPRCISCRVVEKSHGSPSLVRVESASKALSMSLFYDLIDRNASC